MFSLGAGLYQQYLSPTQINVLVIGIQSSGKTTVMERLKVTDFSPSSSSSSTNNSTATAVTSNSSHHHNMTETLRSKIFTRNHADDYKPRKRQRQRQKGPGLGPGETRPKSRFAWICPPPPKYLIKSMAAGLLGADPSTSPMIQQLSNLSDRDLMNRSSDIIFLNDHDDDFDDISLQDENNEETTEESTMIKSPRAFRRGASTVIAAATTSTTAAATKRHAGTISEHGESTGLNHKGLNNAGTDVQRDDNDDDEKHLEFDLLHGKSMLPLEKIRPTIGMNLAKLSVAKAQVHIWDLGGRLVDLWERYYSDADAVLFVWKLSSENSDGNELERQRSVFKTVRASVDCPILVLGNLMQEQPPIHCEPDVLYVTDSILNDTTTLVQFANATTGEGIKSAMEWLVIRAKHAKKQRKPS